MEQIKINANKKKVLALIPARGSSKSIKKKNLLKINNRSLIEWAFINLKKARFIDKIVCSSEDSKILNHCKKIRLEFIKRPLIFSKDTSNVFNAAEHCIKIFRNQGIDFDILVLAQPTSPFISEKIIDKAINILLNNREINSCQTIHQTPHNYHYLNTRRIIKNKFVDFKFKIQRKNKNNKQDKEKTFHFGNIVACKVKKFLEEKNFFCSPSYGLVINKFESYDIDNIEDLNFIKSMNKININK